MTDASFHLTFVLTDVASVCTPDQLQEAAAKVRERADRYGDDPTAADFYRMCAVNLENVALGMQRG